MDARWPDLSVSEKDSFILIAPKSKIENVITDAQNVTLPVSVFGPEPSRNWCYFYEKADLARQQEDWAAIAKIGKEATQLGLQPNDQIEWMPFLQAYAVLGDEAQVKQISTRINTEPFYKQQACQNLQVMSRLTPQMRVYADGLFCGGQ
jgi:hypothetical protein